jgi:transcription elongation factor Elf1
MSLQSQAPLAFEFRRYLSNPSCPRCGNHLVAAEASEYLREGHIRHSWACESCGQEFQTAVILSEAPNLSSPA